MELMAGGVVPVLAARAGAHRATGSSSCGRSGADERLDLRVRAADLRAARPRHAVRHGRRGGGGRRGRLARPQHLPAPRAAAGPRRRRPARPSRRRPRARSGRVPGDIGRRYARVSGDANPIHLHPLTARRSACRRRSRTACGPRRAASRRSRARCRTPTPSTCASSCRCASRAGRLLLPRGRVRGARRAQRQAAPERLDRAEAALADLGCAAAVFSRSSIPSLRLTPGTRSNWMSP